MPVQVSSSLLCTSPFGGDRLQNTAGPRVKGKIPPCYSCFLLPFLRFLFRMVKSLVEKKNEEKYPWSIHNLHFIRAPIQKAYREFSLAINIYKSQLSLCFWNKYRLTISGGFYSGALASKIKPNHTFFPFATVVIWGQKSSESLTQPVICLLVMFTLGDSN